MSIVAVDEAATEANASMQLPQRSSPAYPMIAFLWRNCPRPARFLLLEGCESNAIEPRYQVRLHLFEITSLRFLPGIAVFYRM
jgi:hypothetical protein